MNQSDSAHPDKIRTVLYGGSFNPLHEGHLQLASFVLENNYADEIWFVVSPKNPLKNTVDSSDAELRYLNVKLKLSGYNRCIASKLEFDLPTPSYTIDTIQYAQSRYPDRQFILLIGGDNLDLFTQWKSFDWILENIDILVYPRPGASNKVPRNWKRVTLLNAPKMAISSTEIRRRAR